MKTGALALATGSLLVAMTAPGAQTLRLGASPVVAIGEGTDPSSQFNGVVGVVRLTSGEIAVVNGTPPEIRLFSADGRFERLVARQGSGPGEIAMPYWYGRSNDSLFLFDIGLARITVFDMDANHITTIPFVPRGAPGRMVVMGHVSGNTWLAYTVQGFPRRNDEGPFRDTTEVGVWREDSATVRTIGRFPNVAYYGYQAPGRPAAESTIDGLRPWSAFLATDGRIWVGIPENDDLVVYDPNGSVGRRVRVPFPRRAFSPDASRGARDRAMSRARTAADSARTRRIYDASKRKDLAPAFSRLLPGRSGVVWVEQYREDAEAGGAVYAALDPSGRVVRRLQGPAGVRLFDIGDDYAAGVRRNVDDVEVAVVYRIVPPPPAGHRGGEGMDLLGRVLAP